MPEVPESHSTASSLDILQPDPRNARRHSQDNLDLITGSLREVGAARSIVIDEDNVILAGIFGEDDLAGLIADAPDVTFPEYDESAAEEVAHVTCPACGHTFPR